MPCFFHLRINGAVVAYAHFEVKCMWNKIKPYVISIAIALGVGGLSAWLTSGSMELYKSLRQPPLAPPAAVFPIVWTILFTLMGISAAIVYVKGAKGRADAGPALKVYALQLVFNFLWPIFFFNLQAYLFSFIWLLALWLLILYMIVLFRKISPAAAYLQIPYLLWVAFAGYLNLMIYILNR